MGEWNSLGNELVDSFIQTYDDRDMQALGELIQDRLGCYSCRAFDFCFQYKDSVFDGECYKVLNSFFSDTEEEDIKEYRRLNNE